MPLRFFRLSGQLRRSASRLVLIFAIVCMAGLDRLPVVIGTAVVRQTQSPPLELGKAVERELNGGQTHVYELKLMAGQFAEVTVEQSGINVRATLFQNDGKAIFASDSHRGMRGIERVSVIANSSNPYELKIQSVRELAVPGKYRVTLIALRPVTSQDKIRLTAQELFAEGDRYRGTTDLPKARELYLQALARWETIGDVPRQAVTLRQISAISGQLGLGQQALGEGEQAAKLYRTLGDRSGEAHSIFTVGEAWRGVLHDLDRARIYYEQALPICHEIGERLIEGL
ncbi:MAG: tetratricopeptide repeat protein, partial [Blastocatellia bacterium]